MTYFLSLQDREVQYDDDTYFLIYRYIDCEAQDREVQYDDFLFIGITIDLFIDGITIDCEVQDREVQYDDDTYFLSLFIGITIDCEDDKTEKYNMMMTHTFFPYL